MLSRIRKLRWTLIGKRQIRQAIVRAAARGEVKVVLGASITSFEGWISTDLPHFNILRAADWKRAFGKVRADNLLAEHVFEHLTEEQVRTGIRFCHHYLKPGGRLRIAVPDANHPNPAYLKMVLPPADDHRSSWTIERISGLLNGCGFRVEPLEFYSAGHELTALPIAPSQGPVSRSIQRKDLAPLIEGYSSLIVDAVKS